MAKDLKKTLEKQISEMLDEKDKEPSDGRLKLLALGIKMCALNAKLEESQYGEFFDEPGDTGGVPATAGEKPAARKRANGGTDA